VTPAQVADIVACLKARIAEVDLTSGRPVCSSRTCIPAMAIGSHHCFDSGMRPCAMQSVSVGPSTSARASGLNSFKRGRAVLVAEFARRRPRRPGKESP
jgi:hypothetical protein